jgi:Zn-dependent protease with chaperone function
MAQSLFNPKLRTPRERTLRKVAIVISTIAWIALVASIIGAVYGLLIAAAIAVAHALFVAHVRGNGVRIGPNQLPDVWHKVVRASQQLGLPTVPEVYLVQSGGALNAFATKLLGRRFVILYSQLVDECLRAGPQVGDLPDELDFVIAHEIGHLAAGHLSWFLLPVRAVPLLGPAYSRACEYTSDRCGHLVVDDLEVSSRALAILAAGGQQGQRIDLDAFVEQRRSAGNFWMAVYELNASHPYLPKRIAALREHVSPGSAPVVGRHGAAYPLAPLLAFGAGGAAASSMMVVAMIGILAAIAIPSFMRYTEHAKAAQRAALGAPEAPAPPDGRVVGDRYKWTMNALGPAWTEIPTADARKQSPLADRWWTRRDLDAHIAILAEPLTDGMDLDKLTAAVIQNGKSAMSGFQVERQAPLGAGRLLAARALLKDGRTRIAYRYGLFLGTHGIYQVLALAPADKMAALERMLEDELATFRPY